MRATQLLAKWEAKLQAAKQLEAEMLMRAQRGEPVYSVYRAAALEADAARAKVQLYKARTA